MQTKNVKHIKNILNFRLFTLCIDDSFTHSVYFPNQIHEEHSMLSFHLWILVHCFPLTLRSKSSISNTFFFFCSSVKKIIYWSTKLVSVI